MSSLAFYASPFEDSAPPETEENVGRKRKPISRGKTIKNHKRQPTNNAHVAAMIDHIHKSTGTKPDEDSDMGEFNPPGPPVSGNKDTVKPSSHQEQEPPRVPMPFEGEDAPVGPVRVEGFDSGPGPGSHSSAHPYIPYYTAAAGDQAHQVPSGALHGGSTERREELMKKLDYMIHLLEEQHEERTGHVTEELILYSFLGIFVIFVTDSFARAGKYVR